MIEFEEPSAAVSCKGASCGWTGPFAEVQAFDGRRVDAGWSPASRQMMSLRCSATKPDMQAFVAAWPHFERPIQPRATLANTSGRWRTSRLRMKESEP